MQVDVQKSMLQSLGDKEVLDTIPNPFGKGILVRFTDGDSLEITDDYNKVILHKTISKHS